MKNKGSIKTQMGHIIYILKIVIRVNRWLIPFLLFAAVVRGVNTFFSTTYVYRYAINAIQLGTAYTRVLINICGIFAFTLFHMIMLNVRRYVIEKNKLKIERAIYDDILQR